VSFAVVLYPHACLVGQRPQHEDDAVPEEVVGVFHRPAAEDVRRVQRQAELGAALEVTPLLGQSQATLEDRPLPLIDDELGAELLEGGLGEGFRVHLDAEGHLPLQVICRPAARLVIRDASVGLEDERRRQEGRRHARPAPGGVVEAGEVLVAKKLAALRGEKAVEGVAADEVQVLSIGLEERLLGAALTEHRRLPSPNPTRDSIKRRRLIVSLFRPDF